MKLKISEDCNPEIFISLLRKTYEKNNENISDDIIKTIEYFFTFLKKKMKIISLLKSNNVIASQLIFFDLKSAHAVAQVTDSKYLKQGVSSYLTDRIIEYSFNKKMRYLDFNGCNSPHRADFKHSFGAEPKLYFRINSGLNYV